MTRERKRKTPEQWPGRAGVEAVDHYRRLKGRPVPPRPWDSEPASLTLISAGFVYRGKVHNLAGKPLKMLEALLASRWKRCSVADLIRDLEIDEDEVEFPEQAVKDTARKLRKALRRAVEAAGLSTANPLPSEGRGADLTYRLALP